MRALLWILLGLVIGAFAAISVANALQAGQVFINRYGCYDHASPFGGWKESGHGHEMGAEGLLHYTEIKTITVGRAG